MKARDRAEQVGGAALFAGGTALAADSGSTDRRINAAHGKLIRRQADRKFVDPMSVSGKRGRTVPGGGGKRYPSPRAEARAANAAREAKVAERLAKPPIRGKAGALVRTAALAGGIGAAYAGTRVMHNASSRGERVGKAAAYTDLELSPQLGVGIPSARALVNPLAMKVSSGIMADLAVGAMGRRMSRRERRKVRSGAYSFAAAGGMLHAPLGYGARVTGT